MTSDIGKAINESYAEGQLAALSEVFGFIRSALEGNVNIEVDCYERNQFKIQLAEHLNLNEEQREAYGAIRE